VIWAPHEDSDRSPGGLEGTPSALAEFEILPRLTGSFFDGWEAVLIEVGHEERFIFRQEGADAREVFWPAGTFRSVVLRAVEEFKRLANGKTP
jgi:hypothetical protein